MSFGRRLGLSIVPSPLGKDRTMNEAPTTKIEEGVKGFYDRLGVELAK